MDLRCERCKTLYELDDARVSEAGTTVRCTSCGHVFRVRKKVLLMTEAVGASGEFTAVPPPVVEKPPWRVRSPSGRVIAFRELTSMQKWIVERKFGRDDEISLHGDSWKRLGDIAELQPFFLLLDEVDRVHELEERLHRAEPTDAPAESLERALGAARSAPPPESDRATPTPIRLEMPIEPEQPTSDPELPSSEPLAPRVEPAEPTRTGTPAAYSSLGEIGEATLPSPDELPTVEGTVESQGPADEAEEPRDTPRAGLGVDPGVVEDAVGWGESPGHSSKAPWVATVLLLGATAVAAAAYFQIWVPAQEEKFRREAERVSAEGAQKARAAQDAEVRERERQAKEELLAGLAGRADAGPAATGVVAADAGTGGSAAPEPPRGAADPVRPLATAPASMTASVRADPPAETARPRPSQPPEPRARTFDDWMAQGDREREHARARAALDAYDRAIALQPARPEAHVGQGRALLDVGDPRSAVAAFRRALDVNPRYSVAEFWLGEAYRRAGQKPEAIDAYGRYLQSAPEGAEAARARGALKGLQE